VSATKLAVGHHAIIGGGVPLQVEQPSDGADRSNHQLTNAELMANLLPIQPAECRTADLHAAVNGYILANGLPTPPASDLIPIGLGERRRCLSVFEIGASISRPAWYE